MKIAILGTGAIGSLFAAGLAENTISSVSFDLKATQIP